MNRADISDYILEQLGVVRDQCPQLRFGQLIATIGELAADETGHSLWDVEDAEFAAALERLAADMTHRTSDRAEMATAPNVGGSRTTP